MLTVLQLHHCEGITSASMVAIAHSSMLEVWLLLIQCPLCLINIFALVKANSTSICRIWSLLIATY